MWLGMRLGAARFALVAMLPPSAAHHFPPAAFHTLPQPTCRLAPPCSALLRLPLSRCVCARRTLVQTDVHPLGGISSAHHAAVVVCFPFAFTRRYIWIGMLSSNAAATNPPGVLLLLLVGPKIKNIW